MDLQGLWEARSSGYVRFDRRFLYHHNDDLIIAMVKH